MRRNGLGELVPPLSLELQSLVTPGTVQDAESVDWDIAGPGNTDNNTGRSPG